MKISKAYIIGEAGLKDIVIEKGMIRSVTTINTPQPSSIILPEDNMTFPGLINSHDHLDFNLFPQLGNHIYKNYMAWGDDIYENNIGQINAVLKIPQALRTQWGIYKNLLCGVTTVVNHGKKLNPDNELITVFQDCYSLHSLKYEKKWKWKLNDPLKKNKPFVIHTGEGTDEEARNEIDELINANWLKKKMIAVHGVAMTTAQAKAFEALVWCPASNYFLLDATANVKKIKKNTAIVLGTDSTLSAGWSIWDHLRMARKTEQLSDQELLDAVNTVAAKIWNMNNGVIAQNKSADIVVAKKKQDRSGMDNFFSLNPEDILMVISKGNIMLFDESLLDQVKMQGFYRVTVNGAVKYVQGNLPVLSQSIKAYYPEAIFPFG